jgi:hypothetical protein
MPISLIGLLYPNLTLPNLKYVGHQLNSAGGCQEEDDIVWNFVNILTVGNLVVATNVAT